MVSAGRQNVAKDVVATCDPVWLRRGGEVVLLNGRQAAPRVILAFVAAPGREDPFVTCTSLKSVTQVLTT